MVEFQTTNKMLSTIESIIKSSSKTLTIISPYIKIEQMMFERIRTAAEKGINVRIVYGKDDLNSSELDKLESIPGIHIGYYQELHAKCYYNETLFLLGSMNLYQASEKNREMGLLLQRTTPSDRQAFDDAVEEAEQIIKLSNLRSTANTNLKKNSKSKENSNSISSSISGFCIRCHEQIELEPTKPLCKSCYNTWKKYADVEYLEQWCHVCGKAWESSVAKPACKGCYTKFMK